MEREETKIDQTHSLYPPYTPVYEVKDLVIRRLFSVIFDSENAPPFDLDPETRLIDVEMNLYTPSTRRAKIKKDKGSLKRWDVRRFHILNGI
jgi:hypothetical protein